MDIREILAALTGDDGQINSAALSALSAEQIAQHRATLADHVRTNATSGIPADQLAELTRAADIIDALNGEETGRIERATAAQSLADRVTQATTPAPTPVPTPAPVTEPVVEAATEPVVESVTEPAPEIATEQVDPQSAVPVAASASPSPGQVAPQSAARTTRRIGGSFALTAGANLPDIPNGPLTASQAGQAIIERQNHIAEGADGQRFPVLRYDYSSNFPEDRRLGSDPVENGRRIGTVIASALSGQPDPLTAAGGFCAPLAPDYSFVRISTDARPVRDSLRSFNATRGGIRFNNPIPFTTYADASGVWTEQDDLDAVDDPEVRKSCMRIDCPEDTEVRIEAIYRCMTFGNLNARSFPELVQDAMAKSMDYHARRAELRLLTKMDTNSTQLTWPTPELGAMWDILKGITLYVQAFKNRHRVAPEVMMDAWAPAWLRSMLQLDLMARAPGDSTFDTTAAEIDGFLRAGGVNMTWTLDALPGQNFDAFGAGAIDGFPNPVKILVAHPGAHIFLDMGRLDLGLVRDSSLNLANDYQIFNETFEGLATPGFDPVAIEFTVCANGWTSAPVLLDVCGEVAGS